VHSSSRPDLGSAPTGRGRTARRRDRGVVAVGVDVAAEALHVVALDLALVPAVVLSELVHPVDAGAIANLLRPAQVVAIDAPAALSLQPHLEDRRLPPKFRRARCGEVALRTAGFAVPWVSPAAGEPLPSWMATGLEVWRAAGELGVPAVETYPHAVFATLAGAVLRNKQRPAGALARSRVLAPLLRTPAWLAMWGHDGLDALAAALVAWHVARGTARRVDCAGDAGWNLHDGSAVYLPPLPRSPAGAPVRRSAPERPSRRLRLLEGTPDRGLDEPPEQKR
jgi:predicted nuclease with RNAse H fold